MPVDSMPRGVPTSSMMQQSSGSLATYPAQQSSGPISTVKPFGVKGLTAEVVYATNDGKNGTVPLSINTARLGSSENLTGPKPTKSPAATDDALQQSAVMQGFNADAVQPRLRYGDSISLLPDSINGAVAYAGGEDGGAWVICPNSCIIVIVI